MSKKPRTKKPKPQAQAPESEDEAPDNVKPLGSQFSMTAMERLQFGSMTDKRKLANEKRAGLESELEMASLIQAQLQQGIMQRLSIPQGTEFTIRPDGSVIVMDGGKMGKALDRRSKKAQAQ